MISEMVLPEFEHEMASTRKVLERIPEDKLGWKPHDKSMTMGRLAGHVAELANWGVHTLKLDQLDLSPRADGTYESHSMTTREDTLQKFDGWVAEAKEALRSTPDDAFNKTWTLTAKGQTFLSMPRGAVLRNVVLNHMIHHRGQLSVYLRLNGVPVPGMYGPSADEGSGF
ncbi:MAG: DinB family protein [Acidobacteriaceae bacterium]|nr:DinB family protein [Acidobacteriaceae bacterium]